MKQRHQSINGYVLHTRKYRETSLLVEFFTETLGRASAVVKGVYSGKNPKRNLLQSFLPLCLELQGGPELFNVTSVEMQGAPNFYSGEILACGLYLNELLMYTVHRYDPHPQLFQAYQQALIELNHISPAQILREFELILLEELGYGIHLDENTENEYFDFEVGKGFIPTFKSKEDPTVFSREIISQILQRSWINPDALKAAKYLTRRALAPLLAGKTIHSRELLKKS